ncbi:hypothetical protein ABPG72_006385 [Tetrahymena utriculariae]
MSTFATDKVDIQYLKQDNIGKVLAKGLAVLYQEKPKFPVDYLAKWLLNYSVSVNNENRLDDTLKEKENLKKEYKDELDRVQKENQINEETKLLDEQIDKNFQQKIVNEEYHDVLLSHEFPNFLEERKGLTGVYVGFKDFQVKKINEDEEDEKAHLDQDKDKVINYIGYSSSQKEIMAGKTLSAKEEESFTAAVFKEPEPRNEEDESPIPPTYVYVPDLVKEPRMSYFKIPKLGAYIAFPLKYKSYLKEEFFNDALTKRQEFQVEHDKWETEKKEKEEEFKKEIEALEGDEEAIAAKNAELEQMLAEYPEEPKEQEFMYELKEYVVCADTMGQDRGIPAEDITYLENYVKLFAQSWENMEYKLLSDDIDRQIAYLKEVPKERLDQLNDEEEKAEDEKKPDYDHLKEGNNEKEYQYRLDCVRLERQKELLREEDIQKYIYELAHFRILKFPGILQNILYLLGYSMEEINISGTHILNWKEVKKILNESFINKVIEYNHQGPKPNKVKPYALVNRITAKLEKYDKTQVEEYNIGYARLFKWLQDTCRLRKTDIEIRRQHYEDRVEEIKKKESELEAWETDKANKLAEAKETAEDPENFNDEEWEKTYEEENPRPIVPEAVEADVDEDCVFE